MPSLTMKPLTVTSRDNRKYEASLATCGGCQNQSFAIFMLKSQDHPHYQCTVCDISYCGTWDGRQCKDI